MWSVTHHCFSVVFPSQSQSRLQLFFTSFSLAMFHLIQQAKPHKELVIISSTDCTSNLELIQTGTVKQALGGP